MYFISIDWDFFIWNGAEAKEGNNRVVVRPGTKLEQEVYAGQLFDWGSNERHGASLSEVLWIVRFSGFLRQGLDPYRLVNIAPDRGWRISARHGRSGDKNPGFSDLGERGPGRFSAPIAGPRKCSFEPR